MTQKTFKKEQKNFHFTGPLFVSMYFSCLHAYFIFLSVSDHTTDPLLRRHLQFAELHELPALVVHWGGCGWPHLPALHTP